MTGTEETIRHAHHTATRKKRVKISFFPFGENHKNLVVFLDSALSEQKSPGREIFEAVLPSLSDHRAVNNQAS